MQNRIESILLPKYIGEERVRKLRVCLKLSNDTIFYTFVTVLAYVLFRNEYWFPTMVGGCGSCDKVYKDFPNWPSTSRYELEMYFMIQLGIHTFSLFEMIVIKRKTELKFYELVLHHSVAASLILFSTMSNQIAAGTMTLIVHDASDILMAFARFFIETVWAKKALSNMVYIATTLVWIWMRIIVFPFCLLSNVYMNRPRPGDEWYMIWFEYNYLLTMAIVLYGMHLFWTFLIIKTGLKSAGKKEIVNVHDKKEYKNRC
jgi:hypothetical protein